ncbi:MAG: hypothetical protein O2958_05325 [Gemmatimonadetes bacterium]|nr:hypothetical protein [Gemmatimonadota bacterium]MDA1102808.1 hypothetical protein [Gemmatimonadota bacterium]
MHTTLGYGDAPVTHLPRSPISDMSEIARDRRSPRQHSAACLATALLMSVTACASSGSGSPATDATSEVVWRSLAEGRPTPLAGAARVSVSGVEFLGSYSWASTAVSPDVGVAELVSTGLLRRQDVAFVERRRFAAAAAAQRAGVRPRPGAPPVGVSQSADYGLTAVWIATGSGQASVEVRLATMQSGAIAGATRVAVAQDADPVALARAIVGGLLEVLEDLDRLPVWDDPVAVQPLASRGTPPEAIAKFLEGLAAEEKWDWEGARRGYQAAALPNFQEAAAALARTARLRLGGTLAES